MLSDYIKYVRKVFKVLKLANLFVKLKKCEFYKAEVKLLRFLIKKIRVKMDSVKITAVIL